MTIAISLEEELKAGVLPAMYSFSTHFTSLCTATSAAQKRARIYQSVPTVPLVMSLIVMKYIEISLLKTPLSSLPDSQQVSSEIKAITHHVNFFEMFFVLNEAGCLFTE